jgi:uncharacterized phage protein (TIGR02220 family)
VAASWFPVESSFLRDPRVVRLSKLMSLPRRETIGALLDVWAIAYDRMTSSLPEEDIDAVTGVEGFAVGMVTARLARPTEDASELILAGVTERLNRIHTRQQAGQTGGLASAAKRKQDNKPPTVAQPPVKHPSTVAQPINKISRETSSRVSSDSELSASQTSQESPLNPPPSSSKKPKRKGPALTYETLDAATRQSVDNILERLEKRSGVAYTTVNAHVDLIVARLAEGYSELDLRAVIGWVSAEPETGGRGWEKDEKWRAFISPKTLFGPKKIEEYIDQSRAWLRRNHPGLVTPSTSAPDGRHATKTESPQSPTGVPDTGAGGPPARRDRDEYQPLFGGLLDERR